MYYLCNNCGNTEAFSAWQDYTEWGREQVFINGEGETEDWGEREATDSEGGENRDDYECSACGSTDIEEYDEEEVRDAEAAEIRYVNEGRRSPLSDAGSIQSWKNIVGDDNDRDN